MSPLSKQLRRAALIGTAATASIALLGNGTALAATTAQLSGGNNTITATVTDIPGASEYYTCQLDAQSAIGQQRITASASGYAVKSLTVTARAATGVYNVQVTCNNYYYWWSYTSWEWKSTNKIVTVTPTKTGVPVLPSQ
ncbi:MAG: hypothetical protein LLG14_01190 [Nocardiaceae bacterium]|nr:hypothetical protein [Nocardiaceae bacterium]